MYLDLMNQRVNHSAHYLIPSINRASLKNKFLVFGSSSLEKILSKIKLKANFKFDRIKEVAQGIVAPQEFLNKKNQRILGDDYAEGEGIFILTENELQRLGLMQNEFSLIKPFYTTVQLSRYYGNAKNSSWLIYTDSSFKHPDKIKPFPNVKSHLDRFSEIITSDNKPYGLHRSREEKFFKGEKIISLRKCIKPTFTYTNFDCYVTQTFFIIKTNRLSLKYLTAILKLFSYIAFWLKNKGKMQGNNYQVDKEPLLEIPIRKIDNTKTFEILVDYIIHLHANSTDKEKQLMINYFDNILDAMAYEVYFEEELKKANKDSIKHLNSLAALGADNKENENIVKNAFKLLYSKNHPVRNNLFYLDSIEDVRIIKESLSKQNSNPSTEDTDEDNQD